MSIKDTHAYKFVNGLCTVTFITAAFACTIWAVSYQLGADHVETGAKAVAAGSAVMFAFAFVFLAIMAAGEKK